MKRQWFNLLLALAVAGPLAAGEIVLSTPGTWYDAVDYLPLKAGADYELSCRAEGGTGNIEAVLYQFDAQRNRIGYHNVFAAADTFTMLTAPAVRGTKTITVADASKWDFPAKGKLLAFDAEADGSDLPNHTLAYYITAVSPVSGGYQVDFNQPLRFSRPAGTGVCLHGDGSHLSCSAVLPMDAPMLKIFAPASSDEPLPRKLWKGAAFVKIALRTTSKTPVKIKSCTFTPLDAAAKAERIRAAEAAALKEAQRMTPYGFEKILKNTPEEVVFLNHFFTYQKNRFYWSGTGASSLSVPAAEVGQFEFDLKTAVSCYVRVQFILKKNGKEFRVNTVTRSVNPDGEYHRYQFVPQEIARWDKDATLIGWTIRVIEYKENGKVIGIRNPQILPHKNLFPGAALAKKGEKVPIHELRPLGKYRLSWQNGSCPGTTIRFYNHLMQEIPGFAVTLKRGEKELSFDAPEMLIYAVGTIDGTGKGFPQLDCLHYQMRYKPEIYWKGKWIWSRHEKGPDYSYVWFERTFDVAETPEYAVLGVMADDKSDVYLNGELLGKTFRYSIPDRFFLTGKLKKGKNVLRIRVYNLDSAAGLCTDLYWKNKDGKEGYLLTDKAWRSHENGNSPEEPAAIDSPVVELGNPADTAPWAAYIGFVYVGPRGSFSLLSTKNGKFTAKLNRQVISLFRTLLFERRTISGKKTRLLLPASMTKNADGTVTVTYPEILPAPEPSRVYLIDEFWEVAGGQALAELPAVPVKPAEYRKAEFVNIGTRTMLKFRGKLWNPAFYQNYGPERREPVRKIGVHNYVIFSGFADSWVGLNRYDFRALDEKLELLATIDPEAIFLLDLDLYMPEWWLEAYPDDASAYYEGTRRNTYDDVQALASKHWLTASEAPIKAILDHVREKGYADRVWGVNLSDSRGSEWFWGGATAGTDFYRKTAHPGFSPADYQTFRALLKKWYGTDEALAKAWNMPGLTFATAKMPDPMLRRKGAVGSLFDPAKNRQIMDWCRFRNESLPEAINHFGHYFKKITGNGPLVGCYYGYWMQLAQSGKRSQLITGHNGFMTCLRDDAVDFFRAPSCYSYRRPGDPNGIMQPFSSFLAHNKVVFVENDERTAYAPSQGDDNDIYVCRPSTAFESVGQINREFGMAGAAGAAHYWYENPPGAFYEPALVAVLDEQYKAAAALPPVKGLTPVETAIVGDVESIYYSIDGDDGVFPPAIVGLFWQFNRLGTPFHSMVIDDLLEKGRSPAHKFYIMLPTLVLTKEQREKLLARFDAEKATVLWLYAAGSSYPDNGPSARNCGDFLGIKCTMETGEQNEFLRYRGEKYESLFRKAPWFFPVSGYDAVLAKDDKGRPAVVCKKIGNAAHIFSALPDLPKTLVADILGKAGIFRYVKTSDDPVWAGNDLITLYAVKSGKKKIFLSHGKSLKPILGPMKKTVRSGEEWDAVGGQSYVFLVCD